MEFIAIIVITLFVVIFALGVLTAICNGCATEGGGGGDIEGGSGGGGGGCGGGDGDGGGGGGCGGGDGGGGGGCGGGGGGGGD